MTTAANPITLTAKMMEARNAMRFLFGEKYADKVKPIIADLNRLGTAWSETPIKTMLRACNEIEKDGASGVDLAMVIAAYVEDVEGTFK